MTKPTWGDTVRVKEQAGAEFRPGALAGVCGLRVLETAREAQPLGHAVGTTLYLIEFSDGEAIEVPEAWLDLVPDDNGLSF